MTLERGLSNRALGYPADARLLILNADDLGMCHAINHSIARAWANGVLQSTTLMTPCPWAQHAMHVLTEHPEISFGVHLTVICDAGHYRFASVAPKAQVPSLIDAAGYFYCQARIPEFLAQAKLSELEIEFRAQIELVLAAGLRPTHLDWRCLPSGGHSDVFDMTVGLAKADGLALRVTDQPFIAQMQQQGLPASDNGLLDSFRLETAGKTAHFVRLLRALPSGLSEWAVHPGCDSAELRAADPHGAPLRLCAKFDPARVKARRLP